MPIFAPSASPAPFGIRVVDETTGRGIPLVELETVHHVQFVSDSNGWIAISDPDLIGTEVFFHVRSHGYTLPKDGFGYSGARFKPTPGGRVVLKLRRVNVAERVCRLTGAGIYADSLRLGERAPLSAPARNANVLGQDSALAVLYRGRMLWFWGDTDRAAYPLGNFQTTGAVAVFPAGKRTAEAGLEFRYFVGADGFARPMCPSPKPGPIWISGVCTTGTGNGEELWAYYARMESLAVLREHGFARWDDAQNVFRFVRELPLTDWRHLDGHPVRQTENGTDYLAGGFCFPVVRVPADSRRIPNPAAYQAFTCLLPNGTVKRGDKGEAVYEWQNELPPLTPEREAELVKDGKLRPDEARFMPRDANGKVVTIHAGSVTWNPWRKKWLLFATQKNGDTSALGEIVYGEANAPTGPWNRVVKIVTHDRYTFYNPVHHPFLDTDSGRVVYFEGTYTAEFSGNPRPTPRYNYNQILYRLDLSDKRLDFARAA